MAHEILYIQGMVKKMNSIDSYLSACNGKKYRVRLKLATKVEESNKWQKLHERNSSDLQIDRKLINS